MKIDNMIKNMLSKNKGASINMQNNWKNMSPIKKNNMRLNFKDSDKDGVPNRWDCQPFNKNKQDSQVYLSKRKDLKKHTMYTYGRDRILIGGRYKNVDFDNQQNINQLSQVLGHEEMHNVLRNNTDFDTFEKLDNISNPSYMELNERRKVDLVTDEAPAKLAGPRSKKEYIDYRKQQGFNL